MWNNKLTGGISLSWLYVKLRIERLFNVRQKESSITVIRFLLKFRFSTRGHRSNASTATSSIASIWLKLRSSSFISGHMQDTARLAATPWFSASLTSGSVKIWLIESRHRMHFKVLRLLLTTFKLDKILGETRFSSRNRTLLNRVRSIIPLLGRVPSLFASAVQVIQSVGEYLNRSAMNMTRSWYFESSSVTESSSTPNLLSALCISFKAAESMRQSITRDSEDPRILSHSSFNFFPSLATIFLRVLELLLLLLSEEMLDALEIVEVRSRCECRTTNAEVGSDCCRWAIVFVKGLILMLHRLAAVNARDILLLLAVTVFWPPWARSDTRCWFLKDCWERNTTLVSLLSFWSSLLHSCFLCLKMANASSLQALLALLSLSRFSFTSAAEFPQWEHRAVTALLEQRWQLQLREHEVVVLWNWVVVLPRPVNMPEDKSGAPWAWLWAVPASEWAFTAHFPCFKSEKRRLSVSIIG